MGSEPKPEPAPLPAPLPLPPLTALAQLIDVLPPFAEPIGAPFGDGLGLEAVVGAVGRGSRVTLAGDGRGKWSRVMAIGGDCAPGYCKKKF